MIAEDSSHFWSVKTTYASAVFTTNALSKMLAMIASQSKHVARQVCPVAGLSQDGMVIQLVIFDVWKMSALTASQQIVTNIVLHILVVVPSCKDVISFQSVLLHSSRTIKSSSFE